jgi:hypothetical protein
MSAAYKGAAIVDAHCHASLVTNLNKSAEWQRAMRRRHRSAVQTLTARGATAAESVRSAVDAATSARMAPLMASKNAAEPNESFRSPFERTRWNMVHPPNRRTEWGNGVGQY